jgi:ribosomal protein L21
MLLTLLLLLACAAHISLQLIVYKMKPKKHYRRKTGHRQELTKFMVTKISA